jgi:IclR family pca regulon transcriptional regulator
MDAIFLLRVPARQVMATMLISGTRVPAYASAIGRVLLAELPEHDLDHFLDTVDLAPITALTVTDSCQLRQTLAQARKRGWAIVDQELEEGVRSAAALIRDASGRPIAALGMSVAARTVSLDDLHADYLPAIVGAAADISKRLGANNVKERHA